VTFWPRVLSSENFNWLIVLIVGTAATTVGTVLTNGVTVRRAHNEIRLWSEVWANQHLTYIAFFPALIVAQKNLNELYKNSCFTVMFLCLIFFVIGLLNVRKHDDMIKDDHTDCKETCNTGLKKETRVKIVRLNWSLACLSLALSLLLLFSLQFGKEEP
jgi:Mn2+/Fe2+ NRAMP family transporter